MSDYPDHCFSGRLDKVLVEHAHVSGDTKDGWLRAWVEGHTPHPLHLPAYLQLRYEGIKGKRHVFTIMEGPYKHRKACVMRTKSDRPFIKMGLPRRTAAAIVWFNKSTEKLWYGYSGPVKAISESPYDPFAAPLNRGTYDLRIPEYPHGHGQLYSGDSKYATTWFRIGDSRNVQFLHCGMRSQGCITVVDRFQWTFIYDYLITARKNDQCVGTVKVLETPLERPPRGLRQLW